MKRAIGIDPGESDEARRHALAMLDDDPARRTASTQRSVCAWRNSWRARSRGCWWSRWRICSAWSDQPNIPGTVNEHPNWRQRLPVALEEIASTVDVAALNAAMRRAGAYARDRTVSAVKPTCPCRIEDYATDRRLRNRGAGRPRRLDRLAVLAEFRFRRVLRRVARHDEERPLADRAGRGRHRPPRGAIAATR